jgi:hypothetical protein
MFLLWLIPALTGILLIDLGGERLGIIGWAGIGFGAMYIWSSLSMAWKMYVKPHL